jgi:8-oxo-dGTP diphosphatase
MVSHCLECGTTLQSKQMDGFERLVCPACGWVFYPQLKVGAGGLIENDGKVLLVKRGISPWRGYWYLPAGFLEADETPLQAAEREVYEETGLKVHAKRLRDVYYYDDDPRGNGLLILYDCDVIGGELRPNLEALEARFFAVDEIPPNLASSAHVQAVGQWVSQRKHLS